eukprot:3560448-Rhodomonas_salina.1
MYRERIDWFSIRYPGTRVPGYSGSRVCELRRKKDVFLVRKLATPPKSSLCEKNLPSIIRERLPGGTTRRRTMLSCQDVYPGMHPSWYAYPVLVPTANPSYAYLVISGCVNHSTTKLCTRVVDEIVQTSLVTGYGPMLAEAGSDRRGYLAGIIIK